MSRFFVPCAVCKGDPAHHFGEHVHAYQPDETSAEWAAVKMREALTLCDLVECVVCGKEIPEHAENCKLARAMALADAAGIRNEGGNRAG